MQVVGTTVTILDFCDGLRSREYAVDRNYQRSDAVWPPAARSFLIETILLGFPVPKLSIHQKLDTPTRTVVKNIVDGQQRSRAILDFYENKLRLSRANIDDDFAGKTFADLDEAQQTVFMNYGLSFDVFVGATDEQVREVFRRMNSFTVPLNPEEQRHSAYQGPFKWFINELSKDYSKGFETCDIFTLKQLNRMADAKLLTEIVKAMFDGITTTSRAQLDGIYKRFDQVFQEQEAVDAALRGALRFILTTEELRGTALLKPYNVYALVLAHMQAADQWIVDGDADIPEVAPFRPGEAAYNLSVLAEAIESASDYEGTSGTPDPVFRTLISATEERTNVASQRQRRFEFFLAALQ